MTVVFCDKCRFPMIRITSMINNEKVYGCVNCRAEKPITENQEKEIAKLREEVNTILQILLENDHKLNLRLERLEELISKRGGEYINPLVTGKH